MAAPNGITVDRTYLCSGGVESSCEKTTGRWDIHRRGNGDGQFDDPTSVTVDVATNGVYVANPRNKRIQVFDSNGKFLTKWSVAEWGQAVGFEDLVIDGQRGPALCVERTHERRARF